MTIRILSRSAFSYEIPVRADCDRGGSSQAGPGLFKVAQEVLNRSGWQSSFECCGGVHVIVSNEPPGKKNCSEWLATNIINMSANFKSGGSRGDAPLAASTHILVWLISRALRAKGTISTGLR